MKTFGIYGFNITKTIHFSFGRMIPRVRKIAEIKKLMQDTRNLRLTGFVELDLINTDEIFDLIDQLEKVLTFIEQRQVIITNGLHDNETPFNLGSDYPLECLSHSILRSTGAVLHEDYFSKNSRRYFIEMAINKITIEKDNVFAAMLHKNTLVFSNPKNFIDLSYFLIFSGLETIARHRMNDIKSPAPSVLFKYLKKLEFNVKQQDNTDPYRSLDIYCNLRNALFHNGEFQTPPMKRGKEIQTFMLRDFFSQLRRLNCLVLLKEAGINYSEINWDYVNTRAYFV